MFFLLSQPGSMTMAPWPSLLGQLNRLAIFEGDEGVAAVHASHLAHPTLHGLKCNF